MRVKKNTYYGLGGMMKTYREGGMMPEEGQPMGQQGGMAPREGGMAPEQGRPPMEGQSEQPQFSEEEVMEIVNEVRQYFSEVMPDTQLPPEFIAKVAEAYAMSGRNPAVLEEAVKYAQGQGGEDQQAVR